MIFAFKACGGIVTAENSSGINDGVAAVVLISEAKISELGLNPEAEWMGGALGGVDPAIIGIGPVESTRKLLNRLNMTMADTRFDFSQIAVILMAVSMFVCAIQNQIKTVNAAIEFNNYNSSLYVYIFHMIVESILSA